MNNNNRSNKTIMWFVIICDFVLLNGILSLFRLLNPLCCWNPAQQDVFLLVSNLALGVSETRFFTIIHLRIIGAGDIIQRIVGLSMGQAALTYLLLKIMGYNMPLGWLILTTGTSFFLALLVSRFLERWFVKWFREAGRNMRSVIFVGSDAALLEVYRNLKDDPTLGYRVLGYYGDIDPEELLKVQTAFGKKGYDELIKLGSVDYFIRNLESPENLMLGDDLYLSVSRREKDCVKKIAHLCDRRVVRFYYVPVSVETLGINLKKELMNETEIYTTYENPLQSPVNRVVKRLFDVVVSFMVLLGLLLMLPVIFICIRVQSPGPLFFKQKRTGLDGKNFYCYKFRSMHVNKDADLVQATKDDPRKFPFGNFMRKANIDELPQFWNVLKGEMSVVGPRPHMLAHTEQYSKLIDKYMVRHFVKPGVTGWAQVTGFRGETKELWQMEGRVKRDIWYMEHWSFWLDLRIIWMTARSIFIHDENAY